MLFALFRCYLRYNSRRMEDTISAIIGVLFGSYVLAKSLLDVGKLPGGPARPPAPAVPSNRPAPTSSQPERDPGNGFEDVPVLDAEEWETIQRQNEIKNKISRRAAELKAAGVEITNLENW